jgi:dolichol-phosphate mannosyltransferase
MEVTIIPGMKLKKFAVKIKIYQVLKLLKNYGKENAITAGIQDNIEDFDFKIVIDTDLQHPVEIIPQMIERWQNGEVLINTYREKFQGGIFKRNRIINVLFFYEEIFRRKYYNKNN